MEMDEVGPSLESAGIGIRVAVTKVGVLLQEGVKLGNRSRLLEHDQDPVTGVPRFTGGLPVGVWILRKRHPHAEVLVKGGTVLPGAMDCV